MKDAPMTARPRPTFLLASIFFTASVVGAGAQSISLHALLVGSTNLPRTTSEGFGEAQFSFDGATRRLEYYVSYDGVAPTRIDLHGPAGPAETAGAFLAIPVSGSPISGAATLTPEQAALLVAGKLYIDMHSQAYAEGEVRGQIQKQ
jgi:hypothetical protein